MVICDDVYDDDEKERGEGQTFVHIDMCKSVDMLPAAYFFLLVGIEDLNPFDLHFADAVPSQRIPGKFVCDALEGFAMPLDEKLNIGGARAGYKAALIGGQSDDIADPVFNDTLKDHHSMREQVNRSVVLTVSGGCPHSSKSGLQCFDVSPLLRDAALRICQPFCGRNLLKICPPSPDHLLAVR